jgi:hypothetical protein
LWSSKTARLVSKPEVDRFSWRGAVPEDNEPAFWASGADWLALVDKFGLAPNLEGQR